MVLTVGEALSRHGITGVLTGGACASLYCHGNYSSFDLDFVLSGNVTPADLDRSLGPLGFARQGNRYRHPRSPFWIEFPRGPLAVGADLDVQVVEWTADGGRTSMLSATDACRDRLAAYFHWNDRQSLETAIAIARRNEVDLDRIRAWSREEGHRVRFEEFRRRLLADG